MYRYIQYAYIYIHTPMFIFIHLYIPTYVHDFAKLLQIVNTRGRRVK